MASDGRLTAEQHARYEIWYGDDRYYATEYKTNWLGTVLTARLTDGSMILLPLGGKPVRILELG